MLAKAAKENPSLGDVRFHIVGLPVCTVRFPEALDLALAMEAADKDASEIQKGESQQGDTLLNKADVKVEKGWRN